MIYDHENPMSEEELDKLGKEDFDIEKWNKLFELPLFDYVENYSTGMKKKLAFFMVPCTLAML